MQTELTENIFPLRIRKTKGSVYNNPPLQYAYRDRNKHANGRLCSRNQPQPIAIVEYIQKSIIGNWKSKETINS